MTDDHLTNFARGIKTVRGAAICLRYAPGMGAYGWAFVKPVRKLYYNMTITFASVVVALVVGGIEALALFAGRFHFSGMFSRPQPILSSESLELRNKY